MLLLLRLILLLFIVRAVLMLVRGVMQGISGEAGGGSRGSRPSVQLMRDPVCGVYVSPSKAITEQSGVGVAYFCSERCRQAWRSR
jgi:YHS domain-containing protein